MSVQEFLMYGMATVTAVSAFLILITKNVFRAALLLLACLIGMAGIYIYLSAEFMAMVQILIYAGGVVVLIIFAIMLTTRISGKPLSSESRNIFVAFLICGVLFFILVNSLIDIPVTASEPVSTLPAIGSVLLSAFTGPLEVAGILLLVSLIGAVVMASITLNKS